MLQDCEVVICALLYGNHYELHDRLLTSLNRHVPTDTGVRLWLNAVGENTIKKAKGLQQPDIKIEKSLINVPKYKAMRLMFDEFKKEGCKYKWVVWFDDDSWIVTPNWMQSVKFLIQQEPRAAYVGQKWAAPYLAGQFDFVKKSTWFKSKPLQVVKGRPSFIFAQGAYWWLRRDVLQELDWPDPRLNHNGGDTLLGEAIHQNSHVFLTCSDGVKVNDAIRRGFRETPAGSTITMQR